MERGVAALKMVGGLVFPMFARARDVVGFAPAALWGLRAAALASVLAALWGANRALGLAGSVVPPVDALKPYWLPLLFLLAYILLWLARWLGAQLATDRGEATFPDVDRAWAEALQALDRAGIPLEEVPLFLVLGRTQGSERALFEAADLNLKVRGEPARDDAPLRVYAGRDAIYLTCAGASVLGRLVTSLEDAEFIAPDHTQGVDPRGSFMTLADFRTLNPEVDVPEGDVGPSARPGSTADTRAKAQDDAQRARLRHLGRLIVRDRRPFCSINGVLLLVPVAATNTDHAATQVGLLCQRELAAVRQAMQVRCPVFALICDLETLPGFRELIRRLPEDQRRRRLGQRLPFIPDVDPSLLPTVYDGGAQWIASRRFPAQVDHLWRVEVGDETVVAESVRGNTRLYQLLRQVRERQGRLGRVLTRLATTDNVLTAMLGGCYLAGTGADPLSDQAFIPGVFRRLTDSQDLVSWTPEVLAREARYHRWARQGYIALAVLVAICAGLIVFLLVQKARQVSAGT